VLGQRAGQVHGDLAGDGDVVGPALARHVADAQLVMLRDPLLDRLDRQLVLSLLHQGVLAAASRRGEVDGLRPVRAE
jgi:hypothetical protein